MATWSSLGSTSTLIYCLAEYDGKLYFGATPSGKLWRMDDAGTGIVEVCDSLGTEFYVYRLIVFNGRLYAGMGPDARLYRLNLAGNAWEQVCGALTDTFITSMAVYGNRLYVGVDDSGRLLRLNLAENAWESVCSKYGAQGWIASLCEYEGRLYAGTGSEYASNPDDGGYLLRLNLAGNAWEKVLDPYSGQAAISSLLEYNGNLYAGTGYQGKLFRLNSTGAAWDLICDQFRPAGGYYKIEKLVNIGSSLYACSWLINGGPDTINGGIFIKTNSSNNAWEVVCEKYLGSLSYMGDLCFYNNSLYGGAGGAYGALLKNSLAYHLSITKNPSTLKIRQKCKFNSVSEYY